MTQLDAGLQRVALNQAWHVAEKAGVITGRQQMLDAAARYEQAVANEHSAREAVRASEQAWADAVATAEWMLDGRFVTEGNKTYLIVDIKDQTAVGARKAMTADERTSWRRREANKDPEVVAAARNMQAAEAALAVIRAEIATTASRLSATKHALDASVALLNVLATALGAP